MSSNRGIGQRRRRLRERAERVRSFTLCSSFENVLTHFDVIELGS
jgi:hypothetical protein